MSFVPFLGRCLYIGIATRVMSTVELSFAFELVSSMKNGLTIRLLCRGSLGERASGMSPWWTFRVVAISHRLSPKYVYLPLGNFLVHRDAVPLLSNEVGRPIVRTCLWCTQICRNARNACQVIFSRIPCPPLYSDCMIVRPRTQIPISLLPNVKMHLDDTPRGYILANMIVKG